MCLLENPNEALLLTHLASPPYLEVCFREGTFGIEVRIVRVRADHWMNINSPDRILSVFACCYRRTPARLHCCFANAS